VGRSGGPKKNSPTALVPHVHTSGDHWRQSELSGSTQARSEQALPRWERCARPCLVHRKRIVSSCQQIRGFIRLMGLQPGEHSIAILLSQPLVPEGAALVVLFLGITRRLLRCHSWIARCDWPK